MKKVINIIIVFTLVFTLSGCFLEPEEQYCNEETCYTQDEVDEMLAIESAKGAAHDLLVMALIDDDFYTKDEVMALINEQANVKERTYDIIEVEIVSVNGNIYLVETLNLINSDQYILVSYNHVFVVGDKTHIASYYDGDVRLWNELKEFEN